MGDEEKIGKQEPLKASNEKLWTTEFVLIVVTTFLCYMTAQGLNSTMAVYVDMLGGTAAFAGLIAAGFSIAAGVTRITIGPLMDKVGRLRITRIGMAIVLVSTFLPAFLQGLVPLLVLRTIQGIGVACATTSLATAAADVLPFSRLGEGVGYHGLGQALSQAIGPMIGMFLLYSDDVANLFFCMAAIAVVALIFAFMVKYETRPLTLPETSGYRTKYEERMAAKEAQEESGEESEAPAEKVTVLKMFFERDALSGALPMILVSFATGFSIYFASLYGSILGYPNPGVYYAFSAVAMVAVRILSRNFMDTKPPIFIFGASLTSGLIAFVLFIVSPQMPALFLVAAVFFGCFQGVSQPLCQSVAMKNASPERWGVVSSLFMLSADIGIGAGSILWGLLSDLFGWTITFCIIMCFIVVAFVSAWVVFPNHGKTPFIEMEMK